MTITAPRVYTSRLLPMMAVFVAAAVPAMAQPATVAEWTFDQEQADPALELHGDVEHVGGEAGGALRFDGRDTWAQGPTVASLNIAGAANDHRLLDGQAVGVATSAAAPGFTINARIRPHHLDGEQVLVECYQPQGNQRSFRLALDGDRVVFLLNSDGTVRGEIAGGLRSERRVKAGQWNDITAHFDGRFMGMTINGEEDPARAFCPGIYPAQRPIQVGRAFDGERASAYFDGDIDLIRFQRTEASPPAAAAAPLEPGMRNNLVRDLLEVEQPAAGAHAFDLPRAGWVYVELRGVDGAASASIGDFELALNEATQHQAMKRLPAGQHTLHLTLPEGDAPDALIVRRVPDMMYIRYGYGSYGWDFLSKHVLRHANVCVSAEPPIKFTTGSTRWYVPEAYAERMGDRLTDTDEVVEAWTDAGREWVVEMPSGYWDGEDGWRDALPRWRQGFEGNFAGTLVDEFGYYYDPQAYRQWASHIARLSESAPGRRFFAYTFGLERFPSNHPFLSELRQRDGRIVWEVYIREAPSEAEARQTLHEKLIAPMRIVAHLMPGIASEMVLCPSTWTGMGALNDDFFMDVDQKVFLDMQFHVAATDPSFRGLGGIGPWTSGYSSPEMIRWLGALYRHYGIEGNTELLSSRYGYDYMLDHLDGAGFEKPQNLSLEAAEAGSLVVRQVSSLPAPLTVPDNSYVQPLGQTCLQLTTSSAAPNRVRQAVANLEPGKLYSVKYYAVDLDEPTKRPEQPIPFALDVTGGELVDVLEEQVVIASTRPGHPPVFVTRYLHVFRADGPEAELVLSDWRGGQPRADREGRRMICDNLAVQPYFTDGLDPTQLTPHVRKDVP